MSAGIDAVVIGATGYVGGELLRLIAGHPSYRLCAAVSASRADTPIGTVFPTLAGSFDGASFVDIETADRRIRDGSSLALFSAAPHAASAGAVGAILDTVENRLRRVHVVDSSADFRFSSAADFETVYGQAHAAPHLLERFACSVPEHMPETDRPCIGHPGCFATAVLLAAMPLVAADSVAGAVHVTGVTGSTGSGRSPQAGTHHPERHSNFYAYKPLAHRHVPEIEALIAQTCGRSVRVNFVPHSGPFARGIYVTLHAPLTSKLSDSDLLELYRDHYADDAFVRVRSSVPRLKDVLTSNQCHLGVCADGDHAVVMCAIDNLVKGAAGGAVQWMNRLFDLPETEGLAAATPAWI